jgi:hypothetical protein
MVTTTSRSVTLIKQLLLQLQSPLQLSSTVVRDDASNCLDEQDFLLIISIFFKHYDTCWMEEYGIKDQC